MSQETRDAEPDDSRDVSRLVLGDREIVLVGTAHISRESVDLVRHVIESEAPDGVCVELDSGRYEALSEQRRWEALDLREVIRRRQLATLLANLVLASYQKRLGGLLGVSPGSELLEAVRAAEARDIPVSLCDRDIRATLRRAWHSLSWWRKSWLVSSLLASVFDRPDLTEDDLRELRQQDVLSELMSELGREMPELKHVLIDERDAYLSRRILDTPGRKLVAVVGAGHIEGMRQALTEERPVDLEALCEIPPVSPLWKWIGWSIPALVLGSIAVIGVTRGPEAAGESALYWFLANAIPSGLGGALALAHPVTVATAFLCAPFTSLTPLVGAGYVSAFVQAMLRPPTVREFQSVGEDISKPSAWWSSHLLRIFLVFVLTTLGSVIGTWVGGAKIVSSLF